MQNLLKRGAKVVIASHNEGKVREITELLEPYGIETVSASALGLAEPEETGNSFADNARIKAVEAAKASGLPALADDSGLEVAGLGGAPGIHSARWGGADKDFGLAMARVKRELDAVGAYDDRAHFTCAFALAFPDGSTQVFEGRVYGTVVWPPRGTRGFGYDPIFAPHGFRETFAEMDPRRKHAMSHRARAFDKLMRAVYDD